MEKIRLFENLEINAFKHNKKVYKQWSRFKVVNNDPNYLVLVTESTSVVERWYKYWWTNEPCVVFLFKDRWFNIFATIRENGNIIYYCNLSSPYVKYDDTLMYIDYDLDYKVFEDDKYKKIDINEYLNRKEYFNYSNKLQKIIELESTILENMIKEKIGPFDNENVRYWLNYYYENKEEPIKYD